MTAPAWPSVSPVGDDITASITVTVTNPAPTGTQPVVTSVDIWRRTGSSGPGERIAAGLAPGAVFTDWTPASRVEYQYRATAHASSNGTSTDGSWNVGPVSVPSGDLFTDIFTDVF